MIFLFYKRLITVIDTKLKPKNRKLSKSGKLPKLEFLDSEHPQTSKLNEQMTAAHYVLNILLAREIVKVALSFQIVPPICVLFRFLFYEKYFHFIRFEKKSGQL